MSNVIKVSELLVSLNANVDVNNNAVIESIANILNSCGNNHITVKNPSLFNCDVVEKLGGLCLTDDVCKGLYDDLIKLSFMKIYIIEDKLGDSLDAEESDSLLRLIGIHNIDDSMDIIKQIDSQIDYFNNQHLPTNVYEFGNHTFFKTDSNLLRVSGSLIKPMFV